MSTPPRFFQNGSFFHVFNRGIERRKIFLAKSDYIRFLETLNYYQFRGPKPRFSERERAHYLNSPYSNNLKIVEIVCYCLMPNHFHLLLKQVRDGGITEFMGKVSNSYTKYFNTKYKRRGHLFEERFHSVLIKSDEQLLHVSRYIHLNPYVSKLTNNLEIFPYSSYLAFIKGVDEIGICNPQPVLDLIGGTVKYERFVEEHKEHAVELEELKHFI